MALVLVPLVAVVTGVIGLVRDREKGEAAQGVFVGVVALVVCVWTALASCL